MVIIDPGHGGWDPGGGSNVYFKEKDLTKKISDYQKRRFDELGISSVLVRQSDETLSPSARINKIAEIGAAPNDILISNHINNGGSGGGEVIYALRTDKTLPASIASSLSNQGVPIRNVYQKAGGTGKDYYFILRDTSPNTAMIIEYGFADNDDDVYRLMYNWPELAESVVLSISNYLGVPYSKPSQITYIVKPDDSLFKISNKYGVSIDKLKADNNLTSNIIYPLAELKINL